MAKYDHAFGMSTARSSRSSAKLLNPSSNTAGLHRSFSRTRTKRSPTSSTSGSFISMDFMTKVSTRWCRCSVGRLEKYDSASSSMRMPKNSLTSSSIFDLATTSEIAARSTLGLRIGGRLLFDVGGFTVASQLWSIENMFELDVVRDIGESRLFGSPFSLLKILVGAKDVGAIFPNCDRSPALGCARLPPRRDSLLDMLVVCRMKASFS